MGHVALTSACDWPWHWHQRHRNGRAALSWLLQLLLLLVVSCIHFLRTRIQLKVAIIVPLAPPAGHIPEFLLAYLFFSYWTVQLPLFSSKNNGRCMEMYCSPHWCRREAQAHKVHNITLRFLGQWWRFPHVGRYGPPVLQCDDSPLWVWHVESGIVDTAFTWNF